MKKLTMLLSVALVSGLALAGKHVAGAPDVPSAAATSNLVSVPVPQAVVVDVLGEAPIDPWYEELRGLVEQLSDAYADKPHLGQFGGLAGEKPGARAQRLGRFTDDVLAAVRARAGELAQFGPDAAWGYAVTLAWIAHRETRIASEPKMLGNQDNGKAAGPWQMWDHPGHPDRFQASSALDLLIRDSHAWYLPARQPWLGYPECARWLAAHPAP